MTDRFKSRSLTNWTRLDHFVHIEDPDQDRLYAKGFKSMRLTYCDRWFPMKSHSLAGWAPLGGIMCDACLRNQLRRQRGADRYC